jgi:cobalt-zinc-cadmium efflux system protein
MGPRGDHHPAQEIQRKPHPEQHRHRPGAQAAFRWSVILNCGLSAMQLVIGTAFGSLALIGDAVHNLGDVAGLLLGWGAEHLSTRAPVGRFTYGFGRSTQLASLANGVLILMASAVVLVEAMQRLMVPRPVEPGPVLWAAALGVIVNLLSARLFGSDHSHDLNRRAAVVHLLTDAAVSAAVLVSALLVMATGLDWIDAFTALGVGLAVAWSGLRLLSDAVRIMLDAVPQGIDIEEVTATLRNLEGVVDVHHVHVWALSTSQNALTAHLVVQRNAETNDLQLLHEAKSRLAWLGIGHSTLQLEPAD